MQAPATTRRFDPRQIKQAALALGLLASLAIGATTATIVRDTSDPNNSTATLAGPATTRNDMTGYTFLEQNLHLPTAGAIRTANANYQYMEQNLYLPAGNTAVNSHRNYQFMEQNLYLPASAAATTPDWRVIEQNSWGEDFLFAPSGDNALPPSAGDVPQGANY